jgi:unsaturated chondroitin disaccharide hydrolase
MTEPRISIRQAHEILEDCLLQTAVNVATMGEDFPDYYDPKAGRWAVNGGWTEGFWTGILWRLWSYTGQDRFRTWARRYTRALARAKADFTDHDLGFLFYYSCVLENALTGDPAMVEPALAAARRLADRFNPAGRFIRAHGALAEPDRAGYAIIDTIMNLRLLFWAHGLTGEARLREIAVATADTIAAEYVRPDGSTCQVVWFDPATGAVVRKATHQGYHETSCWSRGQAWAIYGFAQTFKATGDARYREIAATLACYFLERLPADGVAAYDFLDPAPDAPKDTSAQAIAAAGLLALAELSTGTERRGWLDHAGRLLSPLCGRYVIAPAPGRETSRGFLGGGCYFLARNRGVDSELMFGDYYYLEALLRFLAFAAWE